MLNLSANSMSTSMWMVVHKSIICTTVFAQPVWVAFTTWLQTRSKTQFVQIINTVVCTPNFAFSNLLNKSYAPFAQGL